MQVVPRSIAKHVPDSINPDILQAELHEFALEYFATRCLVERRRRHLAEANLIVDRLRFARFRGVQRGTNGRVLHQALDGRRLLRVSGNGGEDENRRGTSSPGLQACPTGGSKGPHYLRNVTIAGRHS
jgi:hypothetical protein